MTLKSPKIPYRETVRTQATGHGRHKKQTGGHRRFGDCKLRIEPLPRGGGFEFVNDIFGGVIPRQFVPAVEKGVQESAARGYLAGYPVVDFRAIVYDGSYHEVDSNELSFKMAGRAAFRACMEQAKPALLEPVMHVEIDAPDEFAGAIIGDLNSRRGRVQGMESAGMGTVVRALVPLAEMLSYGMALTSMTQGRGSFRRRWTTTILCPRRFQKRSLPAPNTTLGKTQRSKALLLPFDFYHGKIRAYQFVRDDGRQERPRFHAVIHRTGLNDTNGSTVNWGLHFGGEP